ncbi:3-deoxy-manno-octulosonate cytidylyltransferase [Jannaschia sp. Os4]|uniref:3-deoxy-manno-octulosonate cytidylyltransferase n=1 Tax=Jannaschia sp. Os4 TaxID=2807617 RepID=UPI001939AC9C|nr:3-deoxy-manno-octulosonate cytidylyltransferase [Jannaschia sp. Os4]MBM2577388.1 3-deoxy-manno-octulosonate cytidylyltransferase [Jannaschia sp. Os4]
MRVAILIPARHASTRYPGKPLVELRGPDGAKSLIRRAWEAARQAAARLPDDEVTVAVATDHDGIAEHARGFGAAVAMTSPDAANGTERCAEAAAAMDVDLVVNLQGDAPLTPPGFVTALVDAMRDGEADVATPVLRCDATTYRHFREDRAAGRVGGTTAVFGADYRALYFSKEVVPYLSDAAIAADGWRDVFHHVGLYAYTPAALAAYAALPPGALEAHEGLEQLRFLEHGRTIRCVEVDGAGRVFWELNNPADVARIEEVLNR